MCILTFSTTNTPFAPFFMEAGSTTFLLMHSVLSVHIIQGEILFAFKITSLIVCTNCFSIFCYYFLCSKRVFWLFHFNLWQIYFFIFTFTWIRILPSASYFLYQLSSSIRSLCVHHHYGRLKKINKLLFLIEPLFNLYLKILDQVHSPYRNRNSPKQFLCLHGVCLLQNYVTLPQIYIYPEDILHITPFCRQNQRRSFKTLS